MASLGGGTEPVAETAHAAAGNHEGEGVATGEQRDDSRNDHTGNGDTGMNASLGICHVFRVVGGVGAQGHPTIFGATLKYLGNMPRTKRPDFQERQAAQVGRGYKFIDLFAGVGGFHQALHNLGANCVFASEWNEAARTTYRHNFAKISPHLFSNGEACFNKDITEVTQPRPRVRRKSDLDEVIKGKIPEFDVLCAGFPCQPFSQAGHKLGFDDERGNLFYDIEKIVNARKPEAIFLENVRHLLKHDDERTIREIRRRLAKAGYGEVFEFVVKASDHGLPQHRPRVFIIGFLNGEARDAFDQPAKRELEVTMSDVFGGARVTNLDGTDREIGFTLRVGGKSSPIDDRRNWDGYIVDGRVRRLSPDHGMRMQGFNSNFTFPDQVAFSDRMKQLGNSVAVPAVQDYAEAIFKALKAAGS